MLDDGDCDYDYERDHDYDYDYERDHEYDHDYKFPRMQASLHSAWSSPCDPVTTFIT